MKHEEKGSFYATEPMNRRYTRTKARVRTEKLCMDTMRIYSTRIIHERESRADIVRAFVSGVGYITTTRQTSQVVLGYVAHDG